MDEWDSRQRNLRSVAIDLVKTYFFRTSFGRETSKVFRRLLFVYNTLMFLSDREILCNEKRFSILSAKWMVGWLTVWVFGGWLNLWLTDWISEWMYSIIRHTERYTERHRQWLTHRHTKTDTQAQTQTHRCTDCPWCLCLCLFHHPIFGPSLKYFFTWQRYSGLNQVQAMTINGGVILHALTIAVLMDTFTLAYLLTYCFVLYKLATSSILV